MLLLFVIIEFFPLIKYIACVSFVKGRNSLNRALTKQSKRKIHVARFIMLSLDGANIIVSNIKLKYVGL